MSPQFKIIKVDPDGSGMDYSGHLGMIVSNVKRCCQRCQVVFGSVGSCSDFGPFVPGELTPLNEEAKSLMLEMGLQT